MKKSILWVFIISIVSLLILNGCQNPDSGTGEQPVIVDAETPAITEQPQDETYILGVDPEDVDYLSVAATVKDGGTLSYQWYKADDETEEGVQVSGNVSQIKPEIPTAIDDDPFYIFYYVVVTNSNSNVNGKTTASITSRRARIAVSDSDEPFINAQTPVIDEQPESANYDLFDIITPLTVEASVVDGGDLSYQWYETDAVNNDGTEISGADGESYTPSFRQSGTFHFYVIVTNTNDEATGIREATEKSAIATIVVAPVTLPLTYKVNNAGNAFTGTFAFGGGTVPEVLGGDAEIENVKRLDGTTGTLKALHTNTTGFANLGETVGRVLKTLDAWTIETYVFLDNTLANGDVSPQIFGIGSPELGTPTGPAIWATAQGRFQVRPGGWGGNDFSGPLSSNPNLYTARAETWENLKGRWRHLVFTMDNGEDATKRNMNIYMDGEHVMGFATAGQAADKVWSTTSELTLMPVAYLGKPFNWGITPGEAANNRPTANSQYHSFALHSGYRNQAAVTAMVDRNLLNTLNGLSGISLVNEPGVNLLEGDPSINANSVVATLSATGGTGTITFTLPAGDNNNNLFVITDSNKLSVGNTALTAGAKTIQVRAQDSTSQSIERTFTITVAQAAPLQLRFTFDAAHVTGTTIAAETGGLNGTLVNGATREVVNGISVLALGTGTPYFDMGLGTANIINNASEYTISTYFMYTYTDYAGNIGFWTFTYKDGNYDNADGADRSLNALTIDTRRLTVNVASPPEGGAANTALPYARNWHFGPQQGTLPGTQTNPAQFPASGRWTHLMVTHKDNDLKIWIDGVALTLTYGAQTNMPGNTTPAPLINKLNRAWLGRPYTGSTYATNSKYADFRIYNKALTLEEIGELGIAATLATLNGDD